MSFVQGIVAALIAPLLMVIGFMVWDNHWTGNAFSLNLYKCNLTAIGFALAIYLTSGSFSPEVFTMEKVGALMVSSTIGILIGDWAWLEGMRLLGARKVIVMDSLKPFLAALVGKVFLDERIHTDAFIGLVLTVAGVATVGLEKEAVPSRDDDAETLDRRHATENDCLLPSREKEENMGTYAANRKKEGYKNHSMTYGLLMGILNVVLHTLGALITKKYGVGMTTFEINFIRFGFSGVCMLGLSISLAVSDYVSKWNVESGPGVTSDRSRWYWLPSASPSTWFRISVGVAFVSFFFPALTNYAMFQIPLALLLTLESIGPLYSLPLSFVLQNERPTSRACIGAALAVLGIAILSFRGIDE